MKTKNKWQSVDKSNWVLNIGKGCVSYNPKIKNNAFDQMLVTLGSIKARAGKNETAFVLNNQYYILSGDFRKDYEICKNEKECMEVYKKNKKKFGSGFSTDVPIKMFYE